MKLLEKKKISIEEGAGVGIGFGIGWFASPYIAGFVGQDAWAGALGLAIIFFLMGYGYYALGSGLAMAGLFLSGRGSATSRGDGTLEV